MPRPAFEPDTSRIIIRSVTKGARFSFFVFLHIKLTLEVPGELQTGFEVTSKIVATNARKQGLLISERFSMLFSLPLLSFPTTNYLNMHRYHFSPILR